MLCHCPKTHGPDCMMWACGCQSHQSWVWLSWIQLQKAALSWACKKKCLRSKWLLFCANMKNRIPFTSGIFEHQVKLLSVLWTIVKRHAKSTKYINSAYKLMHSSGSQVFLCLQSIISHWGWCLKLFLWLQSTLNSLLFLFNKISL